MGRATPLIPPPCSDIPLGEGRRVRIGSQVGRGSMATVYRGVCENAYGLARTVALKVFDVIATDEHEPVLCALAAAARRSACIRHPNVVHVEDFGLAAPAQPFAIEELVEGRSLAQFSESVARRGNRVPLDVALFIGVEVVEALTGARLASSAEGVRLGIVHGELSSSDVLLSWQGEVKVSDFGVAAAARASSSVRSMHSLVRRVRWLAPEVARGQPGDARSDVFSLGVLLRELLVGPRFPTFLQDSEALVWARDGVVHRSMFEPRPPVPLQTILARALERDPTRRYPHAGAMAVELRRVALQMGVGDGRSFLRAALERAFGDRRNDDLEEVTGEMRMPQRRDTDRFARLRGEPGSDDERPEPLESGTVLTAAAADPDDRAGEG